MARKRANDYDDKRQAILDRSAVLFSAHGYDRASMNKIAEACGVSKANLYHYYKDKEGLLFDVIRFHLKELLDVVEAADNPDAPPETRLHDLIAALLEAYRDADSQHNVQISSMRFLPKERQAELKGMERACHNLLCRRGRCRAPSQRHQDADPGDHVAVRHGELALSLVQKQRLGHPCRICGSRDPADLRRHPQRAQDTCQNRPSRKDEANRRR
jgi:AcrR family transcriptional regulator